MDRYFNINYEFDREVVHNKIAEQVQRQDKGYICVADGVILNIANRNKSYLEVLDNAMFAICDSSYVPLYLKWLYGLHHKQYCGSQIFKDIISTQRYRMAFLGSSRKVLDGLQQNLSDINPNVGTMLFYELPFRNVDEFDYPAIAKMIKDDDADIIWIALGAPKQEIFMYNLKPYLDKGVMIAVGAAFKFFSGVDVARAPEWMVRNHLEFVYRLSKEPSKQFGRCFNIVRTLPWLLYKEWRRKSANKHLQ